MMEVGLCSSWEMERSSTDSSGLIDQLFSWSIEDIFNENLYTNKIYRHQMDVWDEISCWAHIYSRICCDSLLWKVVKIPKSFPSVDHYFKAYVFPLLEETRAELCSSMDVISRAPFTGFIDFHRVNRKQEVSYYIEVYYWRNRFNNCGQEPYKPLPGDIFIVADAKPENIHDLQRVGRFWTFSVVTSIEDGNEEDGSSTNFTVETSK